MTSWYFRRWDEPRGDEHDAWGHSGWYFEVGEDGYALRQVERYDSGPTLRYGPQHGRDEYGFLTDQPFDAPEWEPCRISGDEFEEAWTTAQGSREDG